MADQAEVRRRFQIGILSAMGLDETTLDRSGTSIAPDAERAGSQRVACYSVGRHAVLWCDPALVDVLSSLVSDSDSLSDAAFRSWVGTIGGEIIGQAVMKTQATARAASDSSPGSFHRFDWSTAGDVELVQRFVDASSEDDLGEAELAMDDLDDMAVALLGDDGEILAYASSRPFEYEASFGDIGVIVRDGLRAGGWGRGVVAALLDRVLASAGTEPLYRCDPDNVGSDRLSMALGFETAVSLSVAELPDG